MKRERERKNGMTSEERLRKEEAGKLNSCNFSMEMDWVACSAKCRSQISSREREREKKKVKREREEGLGDKYWTFVRHFNYSPVLMTLSHFHLSLSLSLSLSLFLSLSCLRSIL